MKIFGIWEILKKLSYFFKKKGKQKRKQTEMTKNKVG